MPPSQATILIVDDDSELLEIFALWMTRSGYRVLIASNGVEALDILSAATVDAMISDIRMPVMDGLTLVRRIHEMKLLIPSVIFVSGFGDLNVREMYALGVEAMLPKPLLRNELIQALEASLKDREQLWLTPLPEPVSETLHLTFACLDDATDEHGFSIGRGGICVACPQPVPAGTIVDMAIRFTKEKLLLRGQAHVRWYAPDEQKIGLEFLYLEPESRRWVLESMRGKARFSYIPSC